MVALPPGYRLRVGGPGDRPLLLRGFRRAYRDLGAVEGDHLARSLDQHLDDRSLVLAIDHDGTEAIGLTPALRQPSVALLWGVPAIDQRRGDRQLQIWLLYVEPEHRRRGLARALLTSAETTAIARGFASLGLQVFGDNAPARALYDRCGFTPTALLLERRILQ